jgi:cytochrome c556
MTLSLKNVSLAIIAAASVNVLAADAPTTEKAAESATTKQAKQAIDVRKAAFTLIGNSFRPIGEASQGKIEYNQADIKNRANRILVLTDFLDHSFPESSNLGDPATKTKAEAWTKKADFDKELKKFKEDVASLVKVAATEATATDAFKTAAGAVAKDCKSCHEGFKAK